MQVVEVMSLVSTLAYIQGPIVAIKHTMESLGKELSFESRIKFMERRLKKLWSLVKKTLKIGSFYDITLSSAHNRK